MLVKDSVLGVNHFAIVKNELISGAMPWFYVDHTAIKAEGTLNNFSFNNTMFDVDIPGCNNMTPLVTLCYTALCASLDTMGYQLKELLRIRANLYTRNHEAMIHHPHVDDTRPYNVGILYVTTNNNSPTLLYKERYDHKTDTNTIETINNRKFTIEHVVDSIENRFVMFNGDVFHSSTRPTCEDVRININYNFTLI